MYKATMFADIAYAVEKCVLIDHCKSSTRFSGCSQCDSGYVLAMENNEVVRDSCVKSVDNCLYADLGGECLVCKANYTLHLNGGCYLIDMKNCNPENANVTS